MGYGIAFVKYSGWFPQYLWAYFWLNHDGMNDIAGDETREKICREGRYGNDHEEKG
jgi:hypothetical protein